jgi:anti-sigma factor (TIGR02949 family)
MMDTRDKEKRTCRGVIDLLCDYLEGEIPREDSEALEIHLSDCPPCMAFLNTYRKTTELCRHLQPEDIPVELKEKLEQFIRERKWES